MEKRRQNRSCQQCRKSKKACDGYLVNNPGEEVYLHSAVSNSGGHTGSDVVASCSYCIRTKKPCSLNPHWMQRDDPRNGHGRERTEDNELTDESRDGKRRRFQHPESESVEMLSPSYAVPLLDSPSEILQMPLQRNDFLDWGTLSTAPVARPSVSSSSQGGVPVGCQERAPQGNQTRLSCLTTHDSDDRHQITCGDWDRLNDPAMADCSSNFWDFDTQSLVPSIFQEASAHPNSMSQISSASADSQRELHDGHTRHNSLRPYSDMHLSPFDIGHNAMQNSNRILISDSLLQIYHDVLENNLGCWLAEDTCPYMMQRERHERPYMHLSPDPGRQAPLEWGIAWSNRMYRRVKQLDRSAQAANLVRLTASESRAASTALELAIMAFATQWAQGQRRGGSGRQVPGEGEGFGNEFEQTIRRSMWEQANRALQNVSQVECFRVVFAELVFGLVQEPLSSDDFDVRPAGMRRTTDRHKNVKASTLPLIMDIIVQERTPMFLERGTRKIHALKFRLKALQARFQHSVRETNTETYEELGKGFSAEDLGTVGLLYWLAVMFDTVSSSMNERPVIVPDDECQHEAAQEAATGHTERSMHSKRWQLDLYAQENTQNPTPLHWPCPYEAATRAVARSASVKVLLFRHLSYLQRALRNCEHGREVEDIIRTTLSVYRYWGMTHGSFFSNLTRNYESVPPRIKSWFPCIAIPWHLGSLMLADLIEFVDENRLGCDDRRMARLQVGIVKKIRRTSSIDLADLAAVIGPRTDGCMDSEQLQGFHFAVNESPLLAEPWTALLVRAFTKSAMFHLEETEELSSNQRVTVGHVSGALQASVAQAERCIRALQSLGTKSGMAQAISRVLSESLVTCRNIAGAGCLSCLDTII